MIHNTISKSHRRDTTMAAMLFTIVIVFLLSHSIRLALNIYEAVQVARQLDKTIYLILFFLQMVRYRTIQFWPSWADNLTRFNHLSLVINSSINIIIYTAKVRVRGGSDRN